MKILGLLNDIDNIDDYILLYNPNYFKEISKYVDIKNIEDDSGNIFSHIYLFGLKCKENSLIDKYVLINRKNMSILLYGGNKK